MDSPFVALAMKIRVEKKKEPKKNRNDAAHRQDRSDLLGLVLSPLDFFYCHGCGEEAGEYAEGIADFSEMG